MPTRIFRRVFGVAMLPAVLATLLAGCSHPNDPYEKLANPPLVEARLHTVTIITDETRLSGQAEAAGYQPMNLPPNYAAADEVQGVLWNVPAAVAKEARLFATPAHGPNVRILAGPLPPAAPAADARVTRSFFRNVLGTEVPRLPGKLVLTQHARVQVWTYQIPNILETRKKLRAAAIPVVTEPVAITTPYLGDQKSMSLRAPDGSIVELVETAAQ